MKRTLLLAIAAVFTLVNVARSEDARVDSDPLATEGKPESTTADKSQRVTESRERFYELTNAATLAAKKDSKLVCALKPEFGNLLQELVENERSLLNATDRRARDKNLNTIAAMEKLALRHPCLGQ